MHDDRFVVVEERARQPKVARDMGENSTSTKKTALITIKPNACTLLQTIPVVTSRYVKLLFFYGRH
jgi:hypothetical protein